MPQAPDMIQAVWNAAAGAVVGTLPPRPYARRLASMTLVGPTGSTFSMYRGYVVDRAQLVMTTGRGVRNTWTADAAAPTIGPGEAVTVVWSGGQTAAGSTGTVTMLSEVTG